jgi:hypothetical protein
VTHVLSEQTSLSALLEVQGSYESFSLVLDRSGDEDQILENTRRCNDAIAAAVKVTTLGNQPSATFRYQLSDREMLRLGVDSLRQALPYLYATRATLGQFDIRDETTGNTEQWQPLRTIEAPVSEVVSTVARELAITGETGHRVLRSVRCNHGESGSAAIFILEAHGDEWFVASSDPRLPKVFCQYPIRDSAFVPIAFVLDGRFSPNQERERLTMDESDKAKLEDALCAASAAVALAVSSRWKNAHVLAGVSAVVSGFDPSDASETQWWNQALRGAAEKIARLPIVQCVNQTLPAITDDGSFADFISPRLNADSARDGTTVDRVWPVFAAATEIYPPVQDLAADWSQIAASWKELGLAVNLIALSDLNRWVCGDAKLLSELKVSVDPCLWLVQLLGVVGECIAHDTNADVTFLDGMIPNQKGVLCATDELQRDSGISEKLKDICLLSGLDVRARLLDSRLFDTARAAEVTNVELALETAVAASLDESQLIEELVTRLDKTLPSDTEPTKEARPMLLGSVRLLSHLRSSYGQEALDWVRRLPLLTADDSLTRWTPHRMVMAPTSTWPAEARRFARAYPLSRVLNDIYADETLSPTAADSLVDWDIAFGDPLTTETTELKDRRLKSICLEDSSGTTVSDARLSQVALLQPEVLNRCQESVEDAKALMGLVLTYIAPNDEGCGDERVFTGRRGRSNVSVSLVPALWIADLKGRAWVPVRDGDQINKGPATASTLQPLIDPEWLRDNDAAVRVLSRWFGFDELELRLMASAPDSSARKELRDGLARLVDSAGADPATYTALVEELEKQQRRKRDVERFRRLGLGVQDAIRGALVARGLDVALVDRGFDYQVRFPIGDDLEEFAMRLVINPFLLEVKATTSGAARMTPLRAQTAASNADSYVLCVVDLRDMSQKSLDKDWSASDVEPKAKLVANVGESISGTYRLVEMATQSDVAIKNEMALRYEVPQAVWMAGVTIPDWIANVYDRLKSAR